MQKYHACIDCGSKSAKLTAGRCVNTCYRRHRYHADPEVRRKAKERTIRWMKNNPEKWHKIVARAVAKWTKEHHEQAKAMWRAGYRKRAKDPTYLQRERDRQRRYRAKKKRRH